MAIVSRNAMKTKATQNFFSTIHFLPRSVTITKAWRKKNTTSRITPTIDEKLFNHLRAINKNVTVVSVYIRAACTAA